MLESISERLMETVHAGSPTKHPQRRLETIRAAGELRIPFTSGILVGIGETWDERIASLEALAEVQAEHGHIQEVILQNFVPHERYYGREPAQIADDAAQRYWATGIGDQPDLPLPEWACEVSVEDMVRLVGEARRLLPGVGDPGTAEPRRLVAAARRGGRHRPRRPVRQRRPHLTRAPVPEPAPGAPAPGGRRRGAERAALRLRAVHRPGVGRARRARHDPGALLELHPAPASAARARRRRGRSAPTSSPGRSRAGAPARCSRRTS